MRPPLRVFSSFEIYSLTRQFYWNLIPEQGLLSAIRLRFLLFLLLCHKEEMYRRCVFEIFFPQWRRTP
jgi:hypothetical protein